MGNPLASWHLAPVVGLLNFPRSLLAWDVIVLNVYLALNLAIPFYILYNHYAGRTVTKSSYLPFMYLSVLLVGLVVGSLPGYGAGDIEFMLHFIHHAPDNFPLTFQRVIIVHTKDYFHRSDDHT